MARTVKQATANIKELLRYPLPQCPSFATLISELEGEYHHLTNTANNHQDAWTHNSMTLSSVAGQRVYDITSSAADFYKALKVVTVPSDTNVDPEQALEFVEVEHMAEEWGWLSSLKGQLWYSSHDAQQIAFYRAIGDDKETINVEIRPVPSKAQDYKIIYQQGDWWGPSFVKTVDFALPYSPHARYAEARVALNLLPSAKWCFDEEYNAQMRASLLPRLQDSVARYKESLDEFLGSLASSDVIQIEDWADGQGTVW